MNEHRALNTILEKGGITPLYQPILHVNGGAPSIVGFECLSRGPKGTNFEAANILFDYVRLKREETLVDRACIAAALRHAPRANVRLAINVHASTLGRDADFVRFLKETAAASDVALERLTVEIVEHAPPWDGVSFLTALDSLRAIGVRVALDDVGLGQSNFKMMLDVRPDYLKIDQYFIDSCESDSDRQAVLAAIASLGAHFGAQIVAEGVEHAAAVETLQRYAITLMQGFFFAPPLRAEEAARLLDTSAVWREPSLESAQ